MMELVSFQPHHAGERLIKILINKNITAALYSNSTIVSYTAIKFQNPDSSAAWPVRKPIFGAYNIISCTKQYYALRQQWSD